jgi:hypothetical protein
MFNGLFIFANSVIFFWLLLVILPKWKVTQYIVNEKIVPLYLALLYTIGIITIIVQDGFGFVSNFNSAEGVRELMSDPNMALACWIHILCFDLLIGHYIFQDNEKNKNVPLFVQSIILFFTLMFGPFGFLCYMASSMIGNKKKTITEQ